MGNTYNTLRLRVLSKISERNKKKKKKECRILNIIIISLIRNDFVMIIIDDLHLAPDEETHGKNWIKFSARRYDTRDE